MKTCPFIIGLLSVALSAMLSACHSPQREAKPCPQEEILYQLEGCYTQSPDSSLQILDTMDVSSLSKKEQAHYCLLKVMVCDYLHKYDDDDSLLKVAKDYFIGSKDKYFEAKTYEELARINHLEGKGMQYRLDWLQKAIQSIKQCQSVDTRLVQYNPSCSTVHELINLKTHELHWLLGMAYIECGYKNDGIYHMKKATDYYAKSRDYKTLCASFFTLGEAYLSRKDYDSSLMYFQKGLEKAEASDYQNAHAFYHYTMSKYYRYMYKDFDYENEEEREKVMWQAVAECWKGLSLEKEPLLKYKSRFYSELSRAYGMLHQHDSCIYYAKMQLDLMEKMHIDIVPNEDNAGIYLRIYKSYEYLGNADSALLYASKYLRMQRIMANDPQAVAKIKSEYDKKLEMIQLHSEQQAKRYRLFLLLALTLVALLLVLWLTFRYRKNKELEALRFKEANRQLQSELEQATRHSLQVLQQRAMTLYKTEGDKAWERIVADFETAYPKAMENLKAAHPELTDTERNIVILSFLGFRMKEEAEILHLSPNTVEKYRTNIRKKAGSDPISHLIR